MSPVGAINGGGFLPPSLLRRVFPKSHTTVVGYALMGDMITHQSCESTVVWLLGKSLGLKAQTLTTLVVNKRPLHRSPHRRWEAPV